MTTRPEFDPTAVKIQLVRDSDSAHDFIEWIKNENSPLLGLDVETDGLNWYDGRLRLVQFGNQQEGWAVPFQEFRSLVAEAMRIIFQRRQHVVGHNMKFDLHWLERHVEGFQVTDWSVIHDTMLLAGVIDSSGTKALKDLSEFYVWDGAKNGQKAFKDDLRTGGWDWASVPVDLPSYWVYGVLDTILCVNLFWVLMEKATAAGCLAAYEVERGAMGPLFAQERRGMLVDSDYCRNQIEGLGQRSDEIEAEALDWGIDNITSLPQLAMAFERAGVELVETTATGKWAMNQDAFEGIVARNGEHPLVNLVHGYRNAMKMSNSYYANFLKFQRSDGRVHPFYRQMQAKTGRMSCTDPAMQTLPRPNPEDPNDQGKYVRNAFVAEQGHVLISTDFSNVEARIFAHFAKEMGMQQAIKDGQDLHAYTASQIFNLSYLPDKHDPQRQIAKNCLFCVLFGGGAGKLAQTGGVPLAEAERTFAGLHASFPGIKVFQRMCQQQGIDNLNQYGKAFIRGIDGRILSMVETDERFYAFTNWLIQSTAAIVLKKRLAIIDAMGLTQFCVATIHDEVVAEVPAEDEEEFKHMIQNAMNDYVQFDVPIVAESGEGAVRLGDAK